MTLTVPVSSSRVTKTTPLAVSGRWRPMTMPAVRASRPCGARGDRFGGHQPALRQFGRAAAPAGGGPASGPAGGSRRPGPGLRWAWSSSGAVSSELAARDQRRQPLDAGDVPHRVVAMPARPPARRRRRARSGRAGRARARCARSATRRNGASARAATRRARRLPTARRSGAGRGAARGRGCPAQVGSRRGLRFRGGDGITVARESEDPSDPDPTPACSPTRSRARRRGAPRRRGGARPRRAAPARRSPSAAS